MLLTERKVGKMIRRYGLVGLWWVGMVGVSCSERIEGKGK
jgi:hypothetical protein